MHDAQLAAAVCVTRLDMAGQDGVAHRGKLFALEDPGDIFRTDKAVVLDPAINPREHPFDLRG